jgi:3-dehydroquinate synthase
MQTIKVELKQIVDNSYPIYIGVDIIKQLLLVLKTHLAKQVVIITDTNIAKHHLDLLMQQLIKHEYKVLVLTIKPGEGSKNSRTKERLENSMFANKINRQALIIAFGGGVVGDLAGYIASTYMRGAKYLQIPTSLLAIFDSSIGGKTAINTRYGKNLVGSFYQPVAVLIDLQFISTLPRRHLVNGIIEAIKIFLTFDKSYFELLANNLGKVFKLDSEFLLKIIKRAVELKTEVVAQDEKEQNLRMALNFGHTLGHAIEKVGNYKILHGVAVGLGIMLECLIAVNLGKLTTNDFYQVKQVFDKLRVSYKLISNYDLKQIAMATLLDKKNSTNKVKCVLLKQIGTIARYNSLVATEVTLDDIMLALQQLVTNKEIIYDL